MNKHPYATILIAIAEGETIELRDTTEQECYRVWYNCHPNLFFANMNAGRHQYEYRIAPKTIIINDVKCVPPVNNSGAGGFAGSDLSFSFVQIILKHGHDERRECMNANFDTAEDAKKTYDALIKPFKSGVHQLDFMV